MTVGRSLCVLERTGNALALSLLFNRLRRLLARSLARLLLPAPLTPLFILHKFI